MRSRSWLLGMALGAITGAGPFIIGMPALLLLVPAVWWSAQDKVRPVGFGGLLVGLGGGMAGLLAYADARCAASNVSGPGFRSTCEAPDITPYLLAAAVLVAAGAGASLWGSVRSRAAGG